MDGFLNIYEIQILLFNYTQYTLLCIGHFN